MWGNYGFIPTLPETSTVVTLSDILSLEFLMVGLDEKSCNIRVD
jgi:hypothetical protein